MQLLQLHQRALLNARHTTDGQLLLVARQAKCHPNRTLNHVSTHQW